MSDEQEPPRRGWRRILSIGPFSLVFLMMHGTASAASIWVLVQSRQGKIRPPLAVEVAAGYTVVSTAAIGLGILGGTLGGLLSQRKRPT